jgi:hypothetical protein
MSEFHTTTHPIQVPKTLGWHTAVREALERFSRRHGTRVIQRQQFLAEELPTLVLQTGSQGRTPAQTVSRELQELRDEGFLIFSNAGMYVLADGPIDVESEDLASDVLDSAIRQRKLRLGAVETGDAQKLARLRKGQARLRRLTLENYDFRCALCDITDERLLIASHIVRWTDDIEARGDLANVICLCRIHDALFEHGYLGFTDDLRTITEHGSTSSFLQVVLVPAAEFRKPKAFAPLPTYLRAHRKRCGFFLQ